jgi:hypothetical protein
MISPEGLEMIQRIVLLQLTDEMNTPEARRQVAEHSREVLVGIPGVESVDVGVPADEGTAGTWDVLLSVRFASLTAVEEYRVHPDHRRYVDQYLRPGLRSIRAFNFELVGLAQQ